MNDVTNRLCDSVRRTRARLGISPEDFASGVGVSPDRLAEIECGRVRPGTDLLLALILTYGVVPEELQAVAAEDDEIARLLARLPRLRGLFRAARGGHAGSPSPNRRGERLTPRRRRPEHISLQVVDHRVSLSWDVDAVEPEALSSARRLLASGRYGQRPVLLNFLKGAWAKECYEDTEKALQRIDEVQAFRGVSVLPVTRIQRLCLSDLPSCAPLLRLAFSMRDKSGWFERILRGPLSRQGLFFERSASSRALTFTHVGAASECARMLGRAWRGRAVGTPFDSAFADTRFDRRVSSSYGLSMTSGEAVLEHVVGLIDMGSRRIWLPYQRLLLPDGDRLACFTVVTRHLACPFLGQRR